MSRAGKRPSGYSWLRDGLIPGQSALLETLWITPWVSLALASNAGVADVRFPLPVLLTLVAAPALAGRWLERRAAVPLPARRASLLALCACLFLVFVKTQALAREPATDPRWLLDVLAPWTPAASARPGLVVFAWFVAGPLLLRGTWLALGEVTSESAGRWFLAGMASFLGLLAFLAAPGMTPAPFRPDRAWLGPLLATYFVVGLGWVALVRQQHLERRALRRSSDR